MSSTFSSHFRRNVCLAVFIFSSHFAVAQTPARGEVQILRVATTGSGCPEGSVQVILAPDASAITVLYDRYNLSVTAAAPNASMECDVMVDLRKPRDFGFSIESADFRGFVFLDEGMTAEQKVQIQSGPVKGIRKITSEFGSHIWSGPFRDEYLLNAQRTVRRPEVLDCVPPRAETKIIINSIVRIHPNATPGSGQVSVDSLDGRVLQKYHLQWQSCGHGRGNSEH